MVDRDSLIVTLFERDSNGRRIFRPFGRLGKSYVIPDEQIPTIVSPITRLFQIMVVLFTCLMITWRPAWVLILLSIPIWIFLLYCLIFWKVRNLEEIENAQIVSVPYLQKLQLLANSKGTAKLKRLIFFSFLFIAAGFWFVAQKGGIVGWFGVGFGVLGVILFSIELYLIKDTPPR